VGSLGWHVFFAVRHLNLSERVVYLVSRLLVVVYYVVYFLVGGTSMYQNLHVHHYLIAFALTLFCSFDHGISLLVLACAAGIQCQAFSVYDFASLFEPGSKCASYRDPNYSDYFASVLFATIAPTATSSTPYYNKICLVTKSGGVLLSTPPGTQVNGMPW